MAAAREPIEPILEVTVADDGSARIVAPRGELDISTLSLARDPLFAGLADGFETVVLDLAGTTFIDSSGIAMVIEAAAHATRCDARFVVRRGPPGVQRVFELCRLEEALPFEKESGT